MARWATILPARAVADIVKAYAERVGLDPTLFACHSTRLLTDRYFRPGEFLTPGTLCAR